MKLYPIYSHVCQLTCNDVKLGLRRAEMLQSKLIARRLSLPDNFH